MLNYNSGVKHVSTSDVKIGEVAVIRYCDSRDWFFLRLEDPEPSKNEIRFLSLQDFSITYHSKHKQCIRAKIDFDITAYYKED